jgi:hypothetical protein
VNIFGLDFTSAPSSKKPITRVSCSFDEPFTLLRVCGYTQIPDFAAFEAFLRQPGPWLAALDFPFGQPRQLLANLVWPLTWERYIQTVAAMDKAQFEETLRLYRASRPAGDKQHLRATDHLANSRSPMMLHRVPVGKMFFQGAPRLLSAGVSVLPCHPTPDGRIVLEGYPALVARKIIGKAPYKSNELGKQTLAAQETRQKLLDGLRSFVLQTLYGFSLELDDRLAAMFVREPMADLLDALLCAIQAAWAYTWRDNNYGIPEDCDKEEGWIIDPAMIGSQYSQPAAR